MLYAAVAVRSFRRYSTYTAATLAGIFTNSVFGIIISFTYIALWTQRPHVGGYDVTDAVTYAWLGQAMIMTVVMWSGGATDDLSDRIRSGDVAIDLYRPVNLLGWYLAADLGRAAYHLLTRGVAPTVIGALLFDLNFPTVLGALAFAVSLPLAVTVSFAIRMLVSASAFWLFDDSGLKNLLAVCSMFSGWPGGPPGDLPGVAPRRGADAALGGVHPDAGRPVAGQAQRREGSRGPGLPGRVGAGAARALRRGAPDRRATRGGAGWLTSRRLWADRHGSDTPSAPTC